MVLKLRRRQHDQSNAVLHLLRNVTRGWPGYLIQGRKKVFRRLNDTGAMIFDCLAEGALQPGSKGWESVLRVRFLHAQVRRRLRNATYWDGQAWGIPINQEDLAVTQLAFSYNVLVGCELAYGMPLPEHDQEAYLHLWRYIGWLIGVSEEGGRAWCGSVQAAKAGMESMVLHLLMPDADSVAVAHHLLSVLDPDRFALRAAVCRLFLGSPLADALKLPPLRQHPVQTAMAYFVMIVMRLYGLAGWLGPVRRLQYSLHLWALGKVHGAPKKQTEDGSGTAGAQRKRHVMVAAPPLVAAEASKAAWSNGNDVDKSEEEAKKQNGVEARGGEWVAGTDALPSPSPLASTRCPVLNAATLPKSRMQTDASKPLVAGRWVAVIAVVVGVCWRWLA